MAPNDRGQLMGADGMRGMREIELINDEDQAVSDAIASTEKEIWDEANALEPDDNSGDRELEGMDADFDGNLQEDATGDIATDAGDDDQQDDEDKLEPGEDDEAIDATAVNDQVDDRGQIDPQTGRVPSGVHRQMREDRDRLAQENAEMRERLARLEGRVEGMSQARPAAQQQPQPEDIDPVIDPKGYAEAIRRQAREDALGEMNRVREQEMHQRVNTSFAAAQSSNRGYEFGAAYQALTSLRKDDPQSQRLVAAIVNAPDPASALLHWWDRTDGPAWRDQLRESLDGDAARREMPQRGARQDAQPRQVFRGPRSLNSAGGRSTMRSTGSPNDLDGSERAIFNSVWE